MSSVGTLSVAVDWGTAVVEPVAVISNDGVGGELSPDESVLGTDSVGSGTCSSDAAGIPRLIINLLVSLTLSGVRLRFNRAGSNADRLDLSEVLYVPPGIFFIYQLTKLIPGLREKTRVLK